MTEQKTIQMGVDLAQTYGPWAAGVFFILILIGLGLFIYLVSMVRKKTEPVKDFHEAIDNLKDELKNAREDRVKLFDRMNKVEVEMEKRVPFTWAEGQLLPQINELTKDVNKLNATTMQLVAFTESQEKTGQRLAMALEKLSDRIGNVEKIRG